MMTSKTNLSRLWALLLIPLLLAVVACDVGTSSGGSSDEPTAEEGDGSATPSTDVEVSDLSASGNGGGSNIVKVHNETDGRFRFKGGIDFNRIPSENVGPVNHAEATASCTDCQTIAVAVQVNVYERGASNVSPENVSLAVNTNCTRCVTISWAVQYVIPVDDVQAIPRDVDELAKDLEKELKYFEQIKSIEEVDFEEAEERFQSVLEKYNEFIEYAEFLKDQDLTEGSEATPSPTASPEATPGTEFSPEQDQGEPTAEPDDEPTSTPTEQPSAHAPRHEWLLAA